MPCHFLFTSDHLCGHSRGVAERFPCLVSLFSPQCVQAGGTYSERATINTSLSTTSPSSCSPESKNLANMAPSPQTTFIGPSVAQSRLGDSETGSSITQHDLAPQDLKDQYRVEVLDSDEDPKQFNICRKWIAVLVIASGAACATCASSIVRAIAVSSDNFCLTKLVLVGRVCGSRHFKVV